MIRDFRGARAAMDNIFDVMRRRLSETSAHEEKRFVLLREELEEMLRQHDEAMGALGKIVGAIDRE